MTTEDITSFRLFNQQIAQTRFKEPCEIVGWMVAMQAQEFAHAKWAIGLRLSAGKPGVHDAGVEKAFNAGLILRTHLMRPTWHFVTPADIRWMLALTAPRVNAINAFMYRKLELDTKIFRRSNDTLVKALQGGKQLTRVTLKSALEKAKIVADGLRLGYLMMRAELDGVICSGARVGKQFTYALLEERVPKSGTFNREEALAALTMRYFESRGPATLKDFAYWSGLTIKDAKAGADMLKSHLPAGHAGFVHTIIDGQEYILAPTTISKKTKPAPATGRFQTTFLMPDYDEYGMSYKDRSALIGTKSISNADAYSHWLVVDGQIAGTWQRTMKGKTVIVETTFFTSLSNAKLQAVKDAVKRYTSFVD